MMHYELQWTAARICGDALFAPAVAVSRPSYGLRSNFGRSGQRSVLRHLITTGKTKQGAVTANRRSPDTVLS